MFFFWQEVLIIFVYYSIFHIRFRILCKYCTTETLKLMCFFIFVSSNLYIITFKTCLIFLSWNKGFFVAFVCKSFYLSLSAKNTNSNLFQNSGKEQRREHFLKSGLAHVDSPECLFHIEYDFYPALIPQILCKLPSQLLSWHFKDDTDCKYLRTSF